MQNIVDLDSLTIDQAQALAAEHGWRAGRLKATGKTAQQVFARGGVWVTVFYAEGRTRPLHRTGDDQHRERLVRDLRAELTA
ncbi:hypothetical protein SEA_TRIBLETROUBLE_94 [Mycobacterium Phage TribleTrouble]|nr:hypothetical protein SEA_TRIBLETROUBLE_94 [Mycobacterium Phage TribleTrouble]